MQDISLTKKYRSKVVMKNFWETKSLTKYLGGLKWKIVIFIKIKNIFDFKFYHEWGYFSHYIIWLLIDLKFKMKGDNEIKERCIFNKKIEMYIYKIEWCKYGPVRVAQLVATKDNICRDRNSNPGFLTSPRFKKCVILSHFKKNMSTFWYGKKMKK